jgi:hypothetical protein
MTLHYVHDFTLPAIALRLKLSNRSGAKAFIVSARRKLKFLHEDCSEDKDKLRAFVRETAKRRSAA